MSGDLSRGWPDALGEMADRVRAFDWKATPLGPPSVWPESVRAIVSLVLASPTVASIALLDDRLLIYNDEAARLYGARHPAALGQPLAATFPESYPTVAPLYDRVFRGEAVIVRDQPLAVGTGAGNEVFDACLTPVRGPDGAVIGAHMVGLEIGERHRAEAALRASEERYRAFVTASADIVFRMSPDWAQMRELNGRGFLADTSEPNEAWMDDYIDPADKPVIRGAIDRAIYTRSMFELEHRVRRQSQWTNR